MGRIRYSLFIGVFLCAFGALHAQIDTKKYKEFSVSAGLNLTQAMLAAPAVSAQASLRYRSFGLVTSYGKNNAKLKNVRGFDEILLNGNWSEIGVYAIAYPTKKDFEQSGLKLGINFGSANTTYENREIFEALPPFEDYVYKEKYSIKAQKYFSFSFGVQHSVHQHIELGAGFVGFYLVNARDLPLPIVSTSFTVLSPVGLYLAVNVVL